MTRIYPGDERRPIDRTAADSSRPRFAWFFIGTLRFILTFAEFERALKVGYG